MMEPFPNCFSICATARSTARNFSRISWLIALLVLGIPKAGEIGVPRRILILKESLARVKRKLNEPAEPTLSLTALQLRPIILLDLATAAGPERGPIGAWSHPDANQLHRGEMDTGPMMRSH